MMHTATWRLRVSLILALALVQRASPQATAADALGKRIR